MPCYTIAKIFPKTLVNILRQPSAGIRFHSSNGVSRAETRFNRNIRNRERGAVSFFLTCSHNFFDIFYFEGASTPLPSPDRLMRGTFFCDFYSVVVQCARDTVGFIAFHKSQKRKKKLKS
jgi:hypothetical protein